VSAPNRAYPDRRAGPSPTPALEAESRTSVEALTAAICLSPEALAAISLRVAELLEQRSVQAAEPVEDRWMTAREAAAYLGLSVDALHRLTARREPGGIPFGQDVPGGRLWFKRGDLDAWRRG
jgi:excisionase family DNA binding protein